MDETKSVVYLPLHCLTLRGRFTFNLCNCHTITSSFSPALSRHAEDHNAVTTPSRLQLHSFISQNNSCLHIPGGGEVFIMSFSFLFLSEPRISTELIADHYMCHVVTRRNKQHLLLLDNYRFLIICRSDCESNMCCWCYLGHY